MNPQHFFFQVQPFSFCLDNGNTVVEYYANQNEKGISSIKIRMI